jgi:hypothetical protein
MPPAEADTREQHELQRLQLENQLLEREVLQLMRQQQ